MIGIIYKAYNKITNKIYIGQTTQTLEERIYYHYYSIKYNKNNYFKNALNKYDKEDWIWLIIDTAETMDELNTKEELWIEYLNSTDRECGYNSIEGGNNRTFNDELKQKLSDAQNKRYEDENERIKIRNSLEKYRAEHPEILKEHSEKIKQYFKRNPQAKKEHSKKMTEYYSHQENREKVSKIKKEYYKQHPEKGKEHGERMRQLYKENPDINASKYKKIRCINTGIIYNSIKEAGEKLGILPSNISAVCRGVRKHTHGLRFEFV